MFTEVNDSNFTTEVINADSTVLVDFWAPWCGPCRMQTPILEALSKEVNGTVKIVKLNTDENNQTALQYGIRSIPTLIIFKNGKETDRMIGVQSAEVLKSKLQ